MAHPQEKAVQQPIKAEEKRGVMILARAVVVRNLSSAACLRDQIGCQR